MKEQVSKCADAIAVCFVPMAEDKSYFISKEAQESHCDKGYLRGGVD